MTIPIGEVISIKGVNIIIELYEESNKEAMFYNGEKFNGVSIQEHLLIQRGFREIVVRVQGEYLDERQIDIDTKNYIRKVELKPIGYFQEGIFYEGIKYLPMIRDVGYLMNNKQIRDIYGKAESEFIVGKMLKEELPVSLPWSKLFNTHIGVFGNTGSGKSNTLTNLYTTLFDNKKDKIRGKSKFIMIDFNGEYTSNQLIAQEGLKKIYRLDTKSDQGDKFPLPENFFWDDEVFGILFKATENTQKPFLRRIVTGKMKFTHENSLNNFVKKTIERALTSTSPKKESPELIRDIAGIINEPEINNLSQRLSWHGNNNSFMFEGRYFNGGVNDINYGAIFKQHVDNLSIPQLTAFDELKVRINTQLLSDLIGGYVQFEHIQPLLKRVDASIHSLERIFDIGEPGGEHLLTIISLRKANQEAKKTIPLLLAKYCYENHKAKVINENPPQHTFHLIVDEAHNVLSVQSNRENESWKDYRLELFEEIIKEGRKFGFYLTLSSQRPADISPTIMSQLHNFFIHRLVNDKDLFLIENCISTLDTLSRQMIPNLAKGCAVITGTSFDLPMTVQFNKMNKEQMPDSDDINIADLWE